MPGEEAFTTNLIEFEAEDGTVRRVRVSAPATESLTLGGRAVPCRRVTVSGDLDATLWYGPSGILVRKRLTAPDGSTILTNGEAQPGELRLARVVQAGPHELVASLDLDVEPEEPS